jgi:G3E family GTPase
MSIVKVNILTGFFGSGKTTLIANITKNEEIKNKVAIIQNEFSEGRFSLYRNGYRERYLNR